MAPNVVTATLLCTALLAGCAPGPEPPGTGSAPADTEAGRAAGPEAPSADETALRELSDRFVRGVRAADPDTVASVYSLRAEVFAPGRTEILLGQSAVREHFARRLEGLQIDEFEIQRSGFVIRPEMAYSFGVWRAVTRPAGGGAATRWEGRITDVYRRERSGPWVVAHENASLTPAESVDSDVSGSPL